METNKSKNLNEMTAEELKALAYDQIILLNQAQNNINLIQAELSKRIDEPKRKPA